MKGFVLDCSIAASWLFEDEASRKTDALLGELKTSQAFVPALWHLELGNVLIQAERRERITPAQVAARLELLDHLPIVTDTRSDKTVFREILSLARLHKLTTYDAAYLELAMRLGVSLATQDKALGRAGRKARVDILPS